MKAIEQYFHVVLFIKLYKMILTFKSDLVSCGTVYIHGSSNLKVTLHTAGAPAVKFELTNHDSTSRKNFTVLTCKCKLTRLTLKSSNFYLWRWR